MRDTLADWCQRGGNVMRDCTFGYQHVSFVAWGSGVRSSTDLRDLMTRLAVSDFLEATRKRVS